MILFLFQNRYTILIQFIFFYIFYVSLIVSPFLETSELQKNMQELERNHSALIPLIL